METKSTKHKLCYISTCSWIKTTKFMGPSGILPVSLVLDWSAKYCHQNFLPTLMQTNRFQLDVWCQFTHSGTQWLTCDLAGDGKTLLWSCICWYCYNIVHIWSQVWYGGLSRRCRQSKFFCWFFYKNAKSQREAIRKLLHYFISPRVKTGIQKNLIPTIDLRSGRAV